MVISDTAIVATDIFLASFLWASIVAIFLAYRTLSNFTRTGPRIREEISNHFSAFAKIALLKLLFWVWLISAYASIPGGVVYFSLTVLLETKQVLTGYFIAAVLSFFAVVSYQFLYQLQFIPSSLQASARFRFSRLIPIWKHLRPFYFQLANGLLFLFFTCLLLLITMKLYQKQLFGELGVIWAIVAVYFAVYRLYLYKPEIQPVKAAASGQSMNVIMIGADTLRADRIGASGYHRKLTPFIDKLLQQGVFFSNCYTPIARTAPALATLLTGLWPQHHKIRDNYPDAEHLTLPFKTILQDLNEQGYETAAIADWAGGDLGKIDFGFKKKDLPDDQWNLKYLIAQGPAEIRLFLTLFTHNQFGKRFLPELYYLAGVPLTKDLTRQSKTLISECAKHNKSFFLTCFSATTHVPFGSDYPYYDMFTDREYSGESRFTMTKLGSPEEIIQKQELGREAYDVDQILNLYDGCVMQFDDEVKDIIQHLEKCGLRDNTIIVIYSDHGADFFETGCWGQGNTLFGDDPSNRVPLLIVEPGKETGKVVTDVTRAVDFVPTLRELLHMNPDEHVDGKSLVPMMASMDAHESLYAFQETGIWLGRVPNMYPEQLHYPNLIELLDIKDKQQGTLNIKNDYFPTIMQAKNRSVRDSNWKLVYVPTEQGVKYLLFDIASDPACSRDIKDEHPEVYENLKAKLDDWIKLDPPQYYLS